MSKTFKVVGNDISDGYHTFDELYEHRVALFVALASCLQKAAFYKTSKDGWFVLFLELTSGQVSYHLPEKWERSVACFATHDDGHKWDGHESSDVIARIKEWVGAQ